MAITNCGAFSRFADADLVSMDLWVPSESVAMHLIDPPSAPKRKWTNLIPWILEDKATAAGGRSAVCSLRTEFEGQLQILVVAKADIQN